MERSPFFKPVVVGTAIVTLVQSIIWFILSVLCFLYYSEVIVITKVESTFRSALESWMYRLYLHKDTNLAITNSNVLNITPKEFIAFCSIYFVISIILMNTSLIVMSSMRNVKEKQINFCQYCIIIIWIITGLLQSLLDLALFALLLDDYNYVSKSQYLTPHMGVVPTAIGVVMTVVARGFLLWIINVSMYAIVMLMVVKEYQKEKAYNKELYPPPMERRSTLRRSAILSEERRPYPVDIASNVTGRSNDSYISDRFDQYPSQVSLQAQNIHRPPTVARFNPPPQSGPMQGGYSNNYGGGLRRSGSNLYSGR